MIGRTTAGVSAGEQRNMHTDGALMIYKSILSVAAASITTCKVRLLRAKERRRLEKAVAIASCISSCCELGPLVLGPFASRSRAALSGKRQAGRKGQGGGVQRRSRWQVSTRGR
jgi:hypothetical protein